jgi:thiamine-phosphate pyrophosphorylase
LLLYYITDRTQFSGPEQRRRELLVQTSVEAARSGVDYIQIREKDLSSRELEEVAHDIVRKVRDTGNATRVLINSRVDIALATGADGVHLRSNDISPADVRRIWKTAGMPSGPVVAASCHTEQEVIAAKFAGADFVVFGPVFEKSGMLGVGLSALRGACEHGIPVLALGGVNSQNARSCLDAGAAGIAGIRVFQDGELRTKMTELRKPSASR